MKNTFDKVVSVGCSFSKDLNKIEAAQTAFRTGFIPTEIEDMKFLYPQLVADKLNAECINLSVSGIDNEYIIHTTLDYAQNNDNKNILYLIQFTYMWRLGFPVRTSKLGWLSLRPTGETTGDSYFSDKVVNKFYDTYIKYFYHEDICLKILLQKIDLLKTWFEFHNISYKFLTTAQSIEPIYTFRSHHLENVDEKKFIEFCSNNNFLELTKDLFYIDKWAILKELNTTKDIHLTKKGHKVLSNLILDE